MSAPRELMSFVTTLSDYGELGLAYDEASPGQTMDDVAAQIAHGQRQYVIEVWKISQYGARDVTEWVADRIVEMIEAGRVVEENAIRFAETHTYYRRPISREEAREAAAEARWKAARDDAA